MEWEFTPQQVVKAEVDYGFEDFRRDLFFEVQQNAGANEPADLRATYDLLFDLCYWLATGRTFDAFVADHAHSPPIHQFLCAAGPAMAANGEMLGAILQRMIMAEVEGGVPWEDGLSHVHKAVERMTATRPRC